MGTNYYVTEDPPCPNCGRGGELIHIGKSSVGWAFALHVIPELGLTSLAKWKRFVRGKQITNEYGGKITKKRMWKIIEDRFHPNGLQRDGRPVDGTTYDLHEGEFS